jgi:hypothetical protein
MDRFLQEVTDQAHFRCSCIGRFVSPSTRVHCPRPKSDCLTKYINLQDFPRVGWCKISV